MTHSAGPGGFVCVDAPPGARIPRVDGVFVRRWDDGPSGWVTEAAAARPGEHVRLDIADEAAIARVRSVGATPWLCCSDPAAVERASYLGIGAWLRGSEVGGAIDVHPITALLRVAHRIGVPFVADGLGVRGMAAALAIGASGVAFSAMPGVRGTARDTVVLGELLDRRFRALGRPIEAIRALRSEETADGLAAAWDRATDRWWDRSDAVIPAGEAVGLADRDPAEVVALVRAALVAAREIPPDADPLGTGRPVVQGPMANVAERPDLAVAVANAGGMPFFALGALDEHQAAQVLDGARRVPGPWGVGIIGFDLSPWRERHAALAAGSGAAAVILAGGSPAFAAEIQRNKPVWMHAPSAGLARLALEAGVEGVIFEGQDAGGHVGTLSSSALWEEGLAAVEAWIDEGGRPPLVILAGGIGDAASAAFARAMAAGASRRGARVVVQAGTAFLLTHEAVESRQLTMACQRVALGCTRTILVGSSARLPLRVAPNAWADEARAAESRASGSLDERRAALERVNVGRTRIAAKGIERNPEPGARYRDVPAARQLAEGAFTLGSGAAVTREIVSVADVVAALSDGARALLAGEAGARRGIGPVRGVAGGPDVHAPADEPSSVQLASRKSAWITPGVPAGSAPVAAVGPDRGDVPGDRPGEGRGRESQLRPRIADEHDHHRHDDGRQDAHEGEPRGSGRLEAREPIAIIGLGCVMPRAFDVPSFWANLVHGVDAVGPIPPERWDPALYHDPRATANGAELTRSAVAGAVVGFELDPLEYRIPPKVFASMDPTQRMALAAARQAVAGLDLDPERAAVVLGNAMGGEFVKGLSVRVRAREILGMVRQDPAVDLDDAAWSALVARVGQQLEDRLPPMNANSMGGLLSNVVAGRVAAWLDWHGGAFTVDAACASALASVAIAVDWLRNGRCDYALAGGVDGDLSPETFVGFSLAGALSSEGSRPFAEKADGFVMGEGCGLLLLERLSDAVANGHPIYAVLRGVGESSDGRGRGVTAPHPDGQKRALSRAFADAGLSPGDVGLVEAHGTGTAIGDATETGVLREIYEDVAPQSVWLGSVKSMLGHLKSAAGAAGALKAVLATSVGVVPPTLHAGPVDPSLGLRESAFKLPRRAVRWDGRRVAAVSAFGFGGTNFHLLLEEPPAGAAKPTLLAMLRAEAERARPGDDAWPLPESRGEKLITVARPKLDGAVEVRRYGADDVPGLIAALERTPSGSHTAAVRLAVVVPAGLEAEAMADARAVLAGARGRWAFLGEGREDLGFVYPGQGSQRIGAAAAVRALPAGDRVIAEIEAALGVDLAALERDPDTLAATTDTRAVHRLLYALSLAWDAVLREAGLEPRVRVGHSLGEFAALVAAGRMDRGDGLRAVVARGDALHAAPAGRMFAIEADEADASALCGPSAWLAARNGARAWVVAAVGDGCAAAVAEARRRGLKIVELAVSRPFHAPVLASAAAVLGHALRDVPIGAVGSVISGLDGHELTSPDQLVAAVTSPVRFWEATRRPVTWVEVGPGTALSRHIDGIALDPGAPLGTVLAGARLWAAGHPGFLAAIEQAGVVRRARWSGGSRAIPAPFPARNVVLRAPAIAGDSAPTPGEPRRNGRLRAEAGDGVATARGRSRRNGVLRADGDAAVATESEKASRNAVLRDTDAAAIIREVGFRGGLSRPGDERAVTSAGPAAGLEPGAAPVGSPAALGASRNAGLRDATTDGAPEPGRNAVLRDPVADAVLAAIGEATGYPRAFLERGGDLEADLGVDSIRKLEILGALERKLGIGADPSDTARLAGVDVEGLVAWAREKQGQTRQAASDAPTGLYQPALQPVSWTPGEAAFEPGILRRGGAWWVRPIAAGAPHVRARAHVEALLAVLRTAEPGPIAAWIGTDPGDAAVAGFVRSLAKEWGTACRVLVGGSDPRVWSTILASPEGTWRWRDGLFREVHVPVDPEPTILPERPVVLAIGGTGGILGPCLAALPGAVGVVVSRRPCEVPPGFSHVAGDARRPEVVARAVALAREQGRIGLVIHAAGVLADRRVGALAEADVAAVLGAKLDVAAAVMEATREDRPHWLPFTSLAGIGGNAGQTLYAAANAVLDAWPHPTGRSTPIAWTAWAERGMARDLAGLLARAGITPLAPDAGSRAFRAVIGAGPVRVAAHAVPTAATGLLRVRRVGVGEIEGTILLDPTQPWLADHAPAGVPLVPYAVWVSAAEKAAALAGVPGPVEEARVHAAAIVTGPWEARVTLADRRIRVVHGDVLLFSARIGDAPAPAPRAPTERHAGDAAPYREDLLFHGPAWRVLARVAPDGTAAIVRVPPGTDAVAAVVDAVWQLAAVRADRAGRRPGLPIAGSWWIGEIPSSDLVLRLDGSDAVVTDAAGRAVLSASDLVSSEPRANDAANEPPPEPIIRAATGEG